MHSQPINIEDSFVGELHFFLSPLFSPLSSVNVCVSACEGVEKGAGEGGFTRAHA